MNRFFVISSASLCASTLLATEVILPGLHEVRLELGGTLQATQGAIAAFFFGMAISPILWGELVARLGARTVMLWGGLMFAAASVAAGFSTSTEFLAILRGLQGLAAGSATVAVPAAIKAAYPGAEGTRAIGLIGVVEAIAPALGPSIGLGFLVLFGWRSMFVFLAVVVVAATTFAVAAAPRTRARAAKAEASYLALLKSPNFVLMAIVHTFSLGAIIAFDVTIPEILRGGRGSFELAFQVIQFLGVACFVVGAMVSSRLESRFGSTKVLLAAGFIHVLLCAILLLLEVLDLAPYVVLVPWWCLFCLVFGLKAPIGFNSALEAGQISLGRASAVIILLQMLLAGSATQIVALGMRDGAEAMPLWICQFSLSALSFVALLLSRRAAVSLVGGFPIRRPIS